MSSLIGGYNYDIFISYRQKDNKHDGWVTEFVNNLKGELESTFKEEISVYFDINPHDGLLETHDVDESLKEKLKCLVFIPIISRTYCDPKSFAWEHEFKAFIDLASQDQFGLKVKLPNGNVASRVLPVRIYDLDQSDIKLCESVLGGVLRGVEFIYAEPGVNRPLKPDDDEKINLNKTKYRNQINKVGNAIKEIISGLSSEPDMVMEEKVRSKESFREVGPEEIKEVLEKPAKAGKVRFLSVIAVIALLIVAGIIAYPKVINRIKLDKLRTSDGRISIAVLPFRNMTNDTAKNDWQDWIQDILITSLSNSEELRVRQTETVNSYFQSKGLTDYASITPSVASKISQKLDASVFIFGSIIKEGAKIRINAQLIDSNTEDVIKSFQKEGKDENIIPAIDTLSIMIKDFLEISKIKEKITPDIQNLVSTDSPEAYRYFIYAETAFRKNRTKDWLTAIKWYSQAINTDSTFYHAYNMISLTYYILGNWASYNELNSLKEGKKWCLKAYGKKDQMTMQQILYTDLTFALYFGTPEEEIKSIEQLLEIDDQMPFLYFMLGRDYIILKQYDRGIASYEKALEIYAKWGSKPYWEENYNFLGTAYHITGQYEKEGELYKKAEQDFPDSYNIIDNQAALALTLGDTLAANEYIEKYISVAKKNLLPDWSVKIAMIWIYTQAGLFDKAEEGWRELSSSPYYAPRTLNSLAYFLIDQDRNINEGLELINKALEEDQENYDYLHTKGWGLYKQGSYKEALELLQKSWDLRRQNSLYNHNAYLHLETAKKAVANQKNN